MKSKNILQVPDSLYEVLGFTLPYSKDTDTPDYMQGGSVTEFIGSKRIESLKRENKYKTYYPRMKDINLLTLNYPSVPQNIHQKTEYIKRIIRKSVLKAFNALSPEKKVNSACLNYVADILSLYDGSIQIGKIHYHYEEELKTAAQILRSSDFLYLTFPNKDHDIVYTDPFCSKKRNGYYYMTSAPSKTVHIIDLPDFLTDILLVQAVHQIQEKIQLPVVQNIFKKYIQAHSEPDKVLEEASEATILAASLKTKTPIPCTQLFHDYKNKDKVYYCPGLSWGMSEKLAVLFCEILEVYQDICYENKHRNDMNRTVATAYITKKNIPKGILEVMEHTSFKNYFKYVEFDEEIDLKAVSLIEREFQVLSEAYFSGKAFFNVKLRFRKLGKHKASGLYYPSLHTLCVDLRSPSSFIHEYFHMLDDQMGDLSLDTAFQDIVETYRQAFLKNMNQMDASIQEQMSGKGKYNLSYFFRRAEIFARCGEIYFVRILKVESSLIQPDLKYAYPQSKELDALIKNYYEDLLNVRLSSLILPEQSEERSSSC